jgi:predicted secreted protein
VPKYDFHTLKIAIMRKRITLKVNETRTFELESHEGGGYRWTIASNDENVTNVQIKRNKPTQEIAVAPLGKSFPALVEIKALAPGKSTILLEEKRSWEKDIKPLNNCRIYITIN